MNDTLKISIDKRYLNRTFLFDFLRDAYWAKGITFEQVLRIIKDSMCFGVYLNKNQIGFARVITDYNTFAYLLDVFIVPKYQNNGVGKTLVEHILNYPELKKVKTWMLKTNDASDFYKKFGFTEPDDGYKIMQLKR